MRTVSTGAGLCVLGACVLGAAALSSPSLLKSAGAAGEPMLKTPNSRIQPVPVSSIETRVPNGARSPNCQVHVEQWFNPVPRLFETTDCALEGERFQLSPLRTPQDLLGNGRMRKLAVSGGYGTDITIDVVEVRQDRNGNSVQVRTRILSGADATLRDNISALGGYFYDIGQYTGWVDVDGDGDLDLCFEAGPAGGWIENIAGGSANNNPYDHDGDGSVNTGDLSLLLLNFD